MKDLQNLQYCVLFFVLIGTIKVIYFFTSTLFSVLLNFKSWLMMGFLNFLQREVIQINSWFAFLMELLSLIAKSIGNENGKSCYFRVIKPLWRTIKNVFHHFMYRLINMRDIKYWLAFQKVWIIFVISCPLTI